MLVLRELVAHKKPNLIVFGLRLRDERKAAGLTQAELAGRSELHRVYIARLESGAVDVPLSTVHRLADALGISADRLFKSSTPEPPPTRPKRRR